MRILALLATYNEERFIAGCIQHLAAQGVDVYLIDNCSTDATVAIAERFAGNGLVGVETFPRDGIYRWSQLLARKAELAQTLDADWFIHVDADEIRLPHRPGITLAAALTEIDGQGFNAVNFHEFTFVPTRESPDHDHDAYERTMRWYYPFLPKFPHRLNAWKRQDASVDLVTSGGHQVDFPGLRMFPISFSMRHYLFLSVSHARKKYLLRTYAAEELALGWHGGRAGLQGDAIELLAEKDLRIYASDDTLDASSPRSNHPLFSATQAPGP